MLHEDPVSRPPERPDNLPISVPNGRQVSEGDPVWAPLPAERRQPLVSAARRSTCARRGARRHAACFWFLLFCLCQKGGDQATAVFSNPVVRVVEYPVKGTSAAELLGQLRERGPKDDGGAVREGLTRWKVRWRPQESRNAPERERARDGLGYSIQVMIPRWTVDEQSPLALQERWLDYLSAVRLHEARHVLNALRLLSQLQGAVARLDLSLPQKRRDADRIAHSFLTRLRGLDQEYDRVSEHGCATGACAREALGG